MQNISEAVGHDVGQEEIGCFWTTLVIMYQNVWPRSRQKYATLHTVNQVYFFLAHYANAAKPHPLPTTLIIGLWLMY